MSILVSSSVSTVLQSPWVHFTHLFSTRDRCTHALRGSSFAMIEKCQTPSSHVHLPSVHRSGSTGTFRRTFLRFIARKICEKHVKKENIWKQPILEVSPFSEEKWRLPLDVKQEHTFYRRILTIFLAKVSSPDDNYSFRII